MTSPMISPPPTACLPPTDNILSLMKQVQETPSPIQLNKPNIYSENSVSYLLSQNNQFIARKPNYPNFPLSNNKTVSILPESVLRDSNKFKKMKIPFNLMYTHNSEEEIDEYDVSEVKFLKCFKCG